MNNNYFGSNPYGQNNYVNPNIYQEQLNKYQSLINQYNNMMPNQMNNKPIERLYAQYVNGYDEVEKAQIPMDGSVTIFFGDKIFWTKKIVKGQPYINTYSYYPVNNQGEPTSSNSPNEAKTTLEDTLKSILERLEKLENGGKSNEQ